jgi:hypothetical protein
MAVLFDRNDPKKNGLDLRWGLSLLLADAGQAEKAAFVTAHQDVLTNQAASILVLTDMDDFYATFESSSWGTDSNWTYRNIYSTAQRFFSDAQQVQNVGGDLFVDLKPETGESFMGGSAPSESMDWFIGTDTNSADAFTHGILAALNGTGNLAERSASIQKASLDGRSDVDVTKIPYGDFGEHFTGDEILSVMRALKNLPSDITQKTIAKYGDYATASAIENCQLLKTNVDWLTKSLPSLSHHDAAQLAFGYLNYPKEDILKVGTAILAQGFPIQDSLKVLAGFTPSDTLHILENAKTNQKKYLSKWETYTGWEKGKMKNSKTGISAACEVTDDIRDHNKYIQEELFKKVDPTLTQSLTPEFLLAKICIESEGLSQCNEHGLMQVSDDAVFNHYYDTYVKKLGYPKDRNNYRTCIAVAAYYLRDECFIEANNPYKSEGVGMACYNRRPERMKTYAESKGSASPLPDITIEYVAKSLVIRKAAKTYIQTL